MSAETAPPPSEPKYPVPLAVMLVVEALPSVVCPVTARVPFEVRDEVAVIEPPVSVLEVRLRALRTLAKRLVDVAFARTPFVAERLVANALVEVALVVVLFVAVKLLPNKLVNEPFVLKRFVLVAFVVVLLATFNPVIVASVPVKVSMMPVVK